MQKCNGQSLPVNQNQTLFSVIGTTYGGDGRSVFLLPNLVDSAPMHRGPGLSNRQPAVRGGKAIASIDWSNMPAGHHSHEAAANVSDGGVQSSPASNTWDEAAGGQRMYSKEPASLVSMHPSAIGYQGTTDTPSHNNLQPFLAVNFRIALEGLIPPRAEARIGASVRPGWAMTTCLDRLSSVITTYVPCGLSHGTATAPPGAVR